MGEYDKIIVNELQKIRELLELRAWVVTHAPSGPNYTLILVAIMLELLVIIWKL